MLKTSLIFLFTVSCFAFFLSERYCKHGFMIINEASFPVQIYIQAGYKKFKTEVVNPNHQKNYRFDLKHFEGDSQEKWHQYNIGYTYQGDASDYIVKIKPEDVLPETLESKTGLISTLKFFFISLARYKGCYVSI